MSPESAKNASEEHQYKFDKNKKSCCLIINIDETVKKFDGTRVVKKIRIGATQEVEKLKDTFTSDKYDTHVMEMKEGEGKVSDQITKYIAEVTKDNGVKGKMIRGNLETSNVFVCVLLAFGGPGFFFDREGKMVSLSTIIAQFKTCLVTKPKLFIIQTCDMNLRPVGGHLYRDVPEDITPTLRWPQEADILIYESNISGEYDWNPGLRKNQSGKRAFPGLQCSTFIKTFCQAFKTSDDGTEFCDIILKTNLKLKKFIENKYLWDLQDETWSTAPRLPMVTDQLCKKLCFSSYK